MMRSFKALTLLFSLFLFTLSLASAQDTAAFPVTIEHKYGSTTLTAPPQRVVAIGYMEQDPLLALGVIPVAVRYWYGDAPNAIFPWAQAAAGDAAPQVLNMPYGNLNYEAILALQPDLISAVTSGITQEEYDTLSQIAPTIAQSGEYIDFGMPWQETTRMIGAAVGKADEAAALIARVEGLYADARTANPQFAGQTMVVAYNYGEARTYGYYTAQDARGRFFTDLGFVIPDELVEIAGESFYADISSERIDLLDQDVLVFLGLQFAEGGREAIEADPLISQLEVMRDGRVVFIPAEYDDALQFSSVLSLEYALEGIVPELQALPGLQPIDVAECASGFTAITHALGTACVPENAQRVVALEWTYVENLLALGVQPVGVADRDGYGNWVQVPLALDASVADIGTRQEPNLEAIAALNPDVILAVSFRTGQNYEALNAIAPTVVFDPYPTNNTHYEEMLATFSSIGQIVGREAEAQAILDDLNAHFVAAQAALETAGRSGETFILAQSFMSGDVPTFRLFTDNALAVQVLEQMGLQNAWDDAPQQFGFSTVDFEAFADTGDTSFFYIAQEDYRETLVASPLWNGLPFVQSERAYWLGGDVWLFGGPLSMMLLMDTVLEATGIPFPEARNAS
jgi:iron complex transport system substrate-binding protein